MLDYSLATGKVAQPAKREDAMGKGTMEGQVHPSPG